MNYTAMSASKITRAPALKVRVVRKFSELMLLAEDWDDLLKRSDFNDVFSSSGFAQAWWRAFGSLKELNAVVIQDRDGRPILIAPLYFETGYPGKLRVIGDVRGDYNNLIFQSSNETAPRMFFTWLAQWREWETLTVRRIPAEGSLYLACGLGYAPNDTRLQKLRHWLALTSPLLYVSDPTQHPRISAAKLKEVGGLLAGYNYRRRIKSLERKGVLRYERLTSTSDCKAFLPALMDMHVTEFASRGMQSLFVEAKNRLFYEHLIEELAHYQTVRLDCLTLDGKLIAGHFGFEWDNRLYHYKLCFDQQYAKESPGLVLLGYMIADAADRGLSEIDFLSPGGSYKDKYASDLRTKRTLRVFRRPHVALLERWALRRGQPTDGANSNES